ncbi:MAG: hypothetical protein JXQ29_06875 [Planctomycetes bacterium]|nr:hypothetical protein [Planctomycetota bacterium]
MLRTSALPVLLALFLLAIPAGAQVAADTPEKTTPPGTRAVAAVRGDLRELLEVKGRLVPAEASELALWLDEYKGELVVLDALPDGAPVNEGDPVVRLDLGRIEEQLRQAEFDLAQQQEKDRHAEIRARVAEETARDELVRAERDNDWAQRRLRGYFEHEKAHKQESERLRFQSEDNRLEDQRDELAQLERMYEEDELVDATEEIVLKRSRRSLAFAQASTELQRRIRAYDRELNDGIRQEELELGAAQKAAGLGRKRGLEELAHEGRRLERERARRDLERQRAALERLRQDREKMMVRSPRRGIVLHGEPEALPGAAKLERGTGLRARSVFATVVVPDRFRVVAEIAETDAARARTGKAAEIAVPAVPGLKRMGAIRVAPLATGRDGKGGNVCKVEIPLDKGDPRLQPRMQCDVAIVVEEARGAVLVPVAAVTKRDDGAFVQCGATAEGPFGERPVVLGATDGKNVVVKDGVTEGEFVLVGGKGGGK